MESEEGLAPNVTMINNKEESNNPSISEKTSLRVGAEHVAAKVNQLLQNLDRASRSNDPPECSDSECMMYGKNNNKFPNYNARKKKTRCYICGDCDHEGWLCKKVTDCFICSKKGHLVADCPNRNVEVDLASTLCLKCGNTGHDMFSCVNNYDPEDLKAIECYICRKADHLCCAGDKTILIGASCYNCGQSDHFGLECTEPNGVPYGPESVCEKCETRGHHTRLSLHKKQVKTAAEKATERRAKRATPANAATDKAAARRAKRKARRARKLNTTDTTPIVNPNPNQPNGFPLPQIVGSNYGQPGSKILPPASNGPGPLPSHQQHINDQLGTHVPNSLSPPTQFPHNSSPNFQNSPQITQIPFNQETQNMAPPGTEIRRPVVQPPILTQFSPDKKQVKTAAEKAPERSPPANTATNKAAARSAKRKARRARKLNITDKMPIFNPNPDQPNSLSLPPIVGSNYEQPGSKIPPHASNGPSPLPNGPVPLPNGPGPLPNGPGPLPTGPDPLPNGPDPLPTGPGPLPTGPGPLPSHQQHINDQLGTHVPNSLSPPTQFPHNSSPNLQNRPQITQIPLNQETRNMAPPRIRRPVVQPPALTQFSPDKKQVKTVPEKATERRIKRVTQANAGSDKAAARSTKRKAQGARKLNTSYTTPIVNPNSNQPNGWPLPPIVGSYYEQPGSKMPAPASNDRGPLPFHQQHINYQFGTHIPNYSSPPTQFPRNFYPSFQDRPQITQIPFDHETRNMAPSGTEIRRPVVQPPVLTQFSRVIQNNPQHPPSHQLPWTETPVPLNSTVPPTQFPHEFQTNPSQHFSHQTVIAPSSMGSQYPQQYPPQTGNSCSSMGFQYPQQYPPRPVFPCSSIGSQYPQQYPPRPVIARSSMESQYPQQYPPRPVIARSSIGSQYLQQYPPRPGWTF
ncbi:hypothetical protein CASFOL_032287 [Castilleja foliolosa]|uniref:CCHC-type domain-containing protein n=1 Tax=Castilleja foliolosa TaxID=1961234 RepID=A0ABD3C2T2_9LAMI